MLPERQKISGKDACAWAPVRAETGDTPHCRPSFAKKYHAE